MIDIIKSINQEQGYIYVIKVLGYYKIGKTQNPNNRFGEYTKLMQEPEVIILKKVSNYHNVEIELHKMFKHKHTRGEWYLLNNNDISIIKWYLEYFNLYEIYNDIIYEDLSDLFKAQIKLKYHGAIEVCEDDNSYFVVVKIGKHLTKIPIYYGKTTNIINELSSILSSFSKNENKIYESLQIQKLLSENKYKEEEKIS